MNCKQCNIECKDRKGKIFCSRNCKVKYKYHNNIQFKQLKISNVYKHRNNYKSITSLTLEEANMLNEIRSIKNLPI